MIPTRDISRDALRAAARAAVGGASETAPEDYWEQKVNSLVATVQPGGFSVTRRVDLVLGTILGSCVAACICDPVARLGGLNHFLLPGEGSGAGPVNSQSSRYGVHAMEMLINEILKQGGARSRLQAKVFGGANIITLWAANPVGERNQRFTLEFLRREGIPVTATDLGGERARRIFFKPATNKVLVQVLDRDVADRVRRDEAQLDRRADAAQASGGVELF